MVVDVNLIQLYRCETFEELMLRTARLCESIDVPLLALAWAPAPGPDAAMVKNYVTIWDNYYDQIGPEGAALIRELKASMPMALTLHRANTKARQKWLLRQHEVFQVFGDAPATYFLSEHQRRVMQDFTTHEWREFFAIAISRERDRALFLIAKTQSAVTDALRDAINKVLSTFASAYKFLYIKLGSHQTRRGEDGESTALSSREVECLQWLASGKTLFEAATILGISERTLRYHINNARERLGVTTTVQAIVAAALTYGFDPHDARRSICASTRP